MKSAYTWAFIEFVVTLVSINLAIEASPLWRSVFVSFALGGFVNLIYRILVIHSQQQRTTNRRHLEDTIKKQLRKHHG